MAKKQEVIVVKEEQRKKIIINKKGGFVFTIMPFGGWFDQYYKNIYVPAIKDAGLVHKRADDLIRPSTIVNDIWTFTKECVLVLADLTGKNPNVLYELGLAHAIAKPCIIITQTLEDIPFDLRALRIIEYDKNAPNWGEVLKSKITKSIQEVIRSPLKAVLPTFLDVDTSKKISTVSLSDKRMVELSQEIDSLRREIGKKGNECVTPTSEHTDADTAQILLEEAIQKQPNISLRQLVEEFQHLGLPSDWIIQRSKEIKDRINNIEDDLPF